MIQRELGPDAAVLQAREVWDGFFRGLLDVRAKQVTQEMKVAASKAIANIISDRELRPDYIIPSVFDRRVAKAVARAVSEVALDAGTARRRKKSSL